MSRGGGQEEDRRWGRRRRGPGCGGRRATKKKSSRSAIKDSSRSSSSRSITFSAAPPPRGASCCDLSRKQQTHSIEKMLSACWRAQGKAQLPFPRLGEREKEASTMAAAAAAEEREILSVCISFFNVLSSPFHFSFLFSSPFLGVFALFFFSSFRNGVARQQAGRHGK